jgi:hypothetical protein
MTSKDISGIFRQANRNWSSRIFTVLVIVLLTGSGFILRKGGKKDDCSYFKDQNSQLVNALLEIKRSVNELAAQPTSYVEQSTGIVLASFVPIDTTKPMSQMQQKQSLYNISRKIDSLLLKIRQDSINKSKT